MTFVSRLFTWDMNVNKIKMKTDSHIQHLRLRLNNAYFVLAFFILP